MKYTTIISLLLPALVFVVYVQSSSDEPLVGLTQNKGRHDPDAQNQEGVAISSRVSQQFSVSSPESVTEYENESALRISAGLPVNGDLEAAETDFISLGVFLDPDDMNAQFDSADVTYIEIGIPLPVDDDGWSQSRSKETISLGDPIDVASVGSQEAGVSPAVISIGPPLTAEIAINGSGIQPNQEGDVNIAIGETIAVPPES